MSSFTFPSAVDIREVGLRDGLQLEEPLPLDVKLQILEALVDSVARRIEATSFVSPRAVPALADAEDLARHLPRWPEARFSALVAGLGGAHRAIAAGIRELEYVVSAADGHSLANVGRTTEESVALIGQVASLAHEVGGWCEVIVAVAWDCPFDGPTPVERTAQLARRAVDLGADQICLGDTIGTTVPGRVAEFVSAVRRECPGTPLGVHSHEASPRRSFEGCPLPLVSSSRCPVDQDDSSIAFTRRGPSAVTSAETDAGIADGQ